MRANFLGWLERYQSVDPVFTESLFWEPERQGAPKRPDLYVVAINQAGKNPDKFLQ